MPGYEDRLKDYVDVKERIRLFYEKHPDGRLVTEIRFTSAEEGRDDGMVDGIARVLVHAQAYRTPDDTLPGDGWSWMNLPGTTNFTRGSELENTETSAWGRAIGALGIGIEKSIASANEVANKEGPVDHKAAVMADALGREKKQPQDNGDGSLIGTGELAKDFADFLPKQGPDGYVIAFKLVSDAGGIKVIATGLLAEIIPTIKDDIIGKRVSVWGRVEDVPYTGKRKDGTTFSKPYQVLKMDRIRTESGTFPMVEAPTAPLFDDVEL